MLDELFRLLKCVVLLSHYLSSARIDMPSAQTGGEWDGRRVLVLYVSFCLFYTFLVKNQANNAKIPSNTPPKNFRSPKGLISSAG